MSYLYHDRVEIDVQADIFQTEVNSTINELGGNLDKYTTDHDYP